MNSSLQKRIFLALMVLLTAIPVPAGHSEENQAAEMYVIGAGDVLDIQVWDHDDLRRKVEVSQEGGFTFPHIGKVRASGLTVLGAEKLIRDRLAEGYIVNPHVSILVAEYRSQQVFLFGEVNNPGTYAVKHETHLAELISEAGGFTDRAGGPLKIIRPKVSTKSGGSLSAKDTEGPETLTIDLEEVAGGRPGNRFYVRNGDAIYVSKAPLVFVTGCVESPGEHKWEKGLTVHQAIILAGGVSQWGSDKRVNIIRLVNGVERRLEANLENKLLPSDIITVPTLGFFENKK